MRIIAGQLGGLQIAAPKGHRTHPMSDKARGGIFNALGDIKGFTVLDVFAGSGALGLEALSRGAKAVVAVEQDRQAHRVIQENAQTLHVADKLKAIHATVLAWMSTSKGQVFDLVLADPPYDRLQVDTIAKLPDMLKVGGLLVLSWPTQQHKPEIPRVSFIRALEYGDATVCIYKRENP